MRLETLDKLMTAIRTQEEIRRPSVPETAETKRIPYDRPFEDAQVDPDAKGARSYFSRRERLREHLRVAVDEANALAEQLPKQGVAFELATDEESGQTVVHVLDAESRAVLRTLSPTEFLDFMAQVRETIGLFFDRLV